MRPVVLTVWLTLLWPVLWRDLTLTNLAAGLLVALLVQAVFPARHATRQGHTLRPWQLLRFLATFAWELVLANLIVAREVVTPRDRIRTGIVAVPLPDCSDLVVTIVANTITLTPGTITVEVRRDPPVLYVHVLHLYDEERVRRQVLSVRDMVVRAIGSPGAVAHLDGPSPAPTEASS